MFNCTYFVEGKCEQQFLKAIKSEPNLVIPGKVRILNVIQEKLSTSHLLSIRDGYIVFVFDTDVKSTNILQENIRKVKTICPPKVKLLILAQVNNLEDELIRSTDISTICELTSSKSIKDFKPDFIATKNCRALLSKHNFDINKMWVQDIPHPFSEIISNNGAKYVIIKR